MHCVGVRHPTPTEVDERARAACNGSIDDQLRGRDILKRRPSAVEYDDLVGALAPRPPTRHHIGKLRVNVGTLHHTRLQGVVEVPDRRALLEDVGDDGARGHELRLDLVLVRIIRSNGQDRRTGRNVGSAEKPAM